MGNPSIYHICNWGRPKNDVVADLKKIEDPVAHRLVPRPEDTLSDLSPKEPVQDAHKFIVTPNKVRNRLNLLPSK